METKDRFHATFERDHVHMTVTASGRFDRADLDRFKEDVAVASRGRRREWTIDVTDLAEADGAAFVDAMTWVRQHHGHVCVLNPTPALRHVLASTGTDQSIVVRSDSRAVSA